MPDRPTSSASPLILSAGAAAVLAFAALARGAHDLWSATAVHAAVLALAVGTVGAAWRSGRPLRFPAWIGAALLLLVWGVSAGRAGNLADALFAVKDLAAALLIFYVGVNVADNQTSGRVVLCGGVGLLVLQAALAVSQRLTHGAALGGEAPGSLINANVQAGFVLFWVPPLVDAWRGDRGRPSARFWFAGLLAIMILLVATESVGAALCLVVPAFLWAAVIARRPSVRAACLVAGLGIAAALVWYKLTLTYAQTGAWLPPRTDLDRLDWWRTGWQMFLNRPWFGIGPGGYPSAFDAFKVGAGQSTRFAHSLPVTLLAETGLAGLAAVGATAALWLRGVTSAETTRRLPFALGAALFLAFTSFSLGGEYLANQLTLAFFLGLAAGEAPARAWIPRLPPVILLAGLALLAVPWIASPFLASRLVVTAREDLAAGRAADALTHSASALAVDATMSEAWEARAAALWASGQTDEAIDAIDRASDLNRYQARLLVQKAKMLAGAGRGGEAEKEAERAYLLNPRLFKANGN